MLSVKATCHQWTAVFWTSGRMPAASMMSAASGARIQTAERRLMSLWSDARELLRRSALERGARQPGDEIVDAVVAVARVLPRRALDRGARGERNGRRDGAVRNDLDRVDLEDAVGGEPPGAAPAEQLVDDDRERELVGAPVDRLQVVPLLERGVRRRSDRVGERRIPVSARELSEHEAGDDRVAVAVEVDRFRTQRAVDDAVLVRFVERLADAAHDLDDAMVRHRCAAVDQVAERAAFDERHLHRDERRRDVEAGHREHVRMHDLRGEVGLAHEVAARDRIVPRDLDGYVAVGTALAAAPNGDAGTTQTDGRTEDVTPLERVAELSQQLGGLLALDAAASTAPQTPHTTARGSAGLSHDGQTIWSCVSASSVTALFLPRRAACQRESCYACVSPPTSRRLFLDCQKTRRVLICRAGPGAVLLVPVTPPAGSEPGGNSR